MSQRFNSGLTVNPAQLEGFGDSSHRKSIDETSGVRTQDRDTLFTQNGACSRCDRGMSSFDNRQRLVVSGLYDLPIGKGKPMNIQNGFANAVAGVWQLGSIVTWRSGFPLNPN